MRRHRPLIAILTVALAAALTPVAGRAAVLPPPPASAIATIDPGLRTVLADASPTTEVGVIVRFASAVTDADGHALLAAGFTPGLVRYEVVPAIYGLATPAAIRRAASLPRVEYVEHDRPLEYMLDRSTTVTRSKPVWDATYDVAGEVHEGGITGRGVGIAIIDSGIDARHPDLRWGPLAEALGEEPKTIVNVKVVGRANQVAWPPPGGVTGPFVDAPVVGVDAPDTDVDGGHGTHVAGIAAGAGRLDGRFTGTAPGADLIGIAAGNGLAVHSALAGFDWVHQNHERYGIRVVNNSFGAAGDYSPGLSLSIAVRRLVNEDGVVMVVAAGNFAGDGSTVATNLLANIPEAISVANYYDGTGWVDDTSSRGSKAKPGTWPEVAAPGSQIISTASAAGPVTYFGSGQDAAITELFGYDERYVVPAQTPTAVETEAGGRSVYVGDYASLTGTSMASPAVCGVVALMLEANPQLTPADVEEILETTANTPRGRTFEADGFAMGHGVVDAAEAVAVALRMRDGASLADALTTASVDLTATPARINATPGPVTDNVVPLQPGLPPKVVGNPQIFTAGYDPMFLTETYVVANGSTVDLALRGVSSSDPAITLDPGTYTALFRIVRESDGAIARRFTPTMQPDGAGRSLYAAWEVGTMYPGRYLFVSQIRVNATGETFRFRSLPVTVTAPAG